MKQCNNDNTIGIHPIFKSKFIEFDEEEIRKKNSLLNGIKNFKTHSTIFEIDRKKQKANALINESRKFFQSVINKKVKTKELENKQDEFDKQIEQKDFKDDEFYLPYQSKDHHTEKGLQINSSRQQLEQSVFSIQGR